MRLKTWPAPKRPEKLRIMGFGERKVQPKIWKKCVEMAQADKAWALSVKYDRKWLAGASDESLDELYEKLADSSQAFAERRYMYWFFRAHDVQNCIIVDPAARRDWIAAGGRIERVE